MVSCEFQPILPSSMDLGSCLDAIVASLETETLGPLAEDIFCIRLWQSEEK